MLFVKSSFYNYDVGAIIDCFLIAYRAFGFSFGLDRQGCFDWLGDGFRVGDQRHMQVRISSRRKHEPQIQRSLEAAFPSDSADGNLCSRVLDCRIFAEHGEVSADGSGICRQDSCGNFSIEVYCHVQIQDSTFVSE